MRCHKFLPLRLQLLLWLTVLTWLHSAAAGTNYLYVATNGNDTWSGTLAQPNGNSSDGPKATLAGAQAAVRTILGQAGYKWPTTVQIADGVYALTNAFALGLSDSAGTTNPVVYQAAPGASPVFSGGRVITGWMPQTNGLWTASVPWATGTNYFEQLFVDGRRATRAITPNTDYFYIQATDPVLTNQAFGGYAADVAPLAGLSASDLANATVIAYHNWTTSRLRLSSFSAGSNWLTFSGKARYAFLNEGRYQIENIASALNAPGEWFLAQNGTLTYWPLPGEDLNAAQVVAPQNGNFIAITGNSGGSQFVQNLTFNGLSFQYGQYMLPATGDSEAQGVPDLPAVITLNGARNVVFTNCEVAHIGQHAIRFLQGCQNCVVSHGYLHDLGGGGVYIGETNQESNANNYTVSNVVDNTIIRAGGRIHGSSIGVWIGNSSGNKVTHNEISDFFYTGVSAGWTWGYGTSIATNNLIDGNHIHDLGWGVLSDMGGIYTLGISTGTKVSQNYVHHISRYAYGGWGLYNDQGTSGMLLVSNLVYDTMDGGYMKNYGRTNIIQNNIFACGVTAELGAGQQDATGVSIFFKNNILYWLSGNNLMNGTWSIIANSAFSTNIYWQVSDTNISFIGNTFAQWQALGQDAGSKITDPLFMDGVNGDFRLVSTNAAAAIGFHPFSFTNAGVYGDPAWRATAEAPSQPASLPEPVSFAPFNFCESFEELNSGAPLPNAVTDGLVGGASVIVTSNNPASGGRCLAVTTPPGLSQSFYPYFSYNPPNVTGSFSFAFSIRLAANTQVLHEWRNATGGTYIAGPSFTFTMGQLKVGNSTVTVPSNQWLRVQINVNTTNYATKGWQLGLTKPGSATQWFTTYPTGNATNWNQLSWLGWEGAGVGTASNVYYLDDFNATNFVAPYVNPQPPAPVIAGLTNITLAGNVSSGPLAFNVVDPVAPAGAVAVTVSSSNPRLLPASSFVLGGAGTNRTLTVTPTSGLSGMGMVYVTADNGTFHSSQSFQVTVLASPVLSFSGGSTGFHLAWPPGGGAFGVWQATNLIQPNWIPVAGTPVLSNGVWQLPVNAGSGVYYRLQAATP